MLSVKIRRVQKNCTLCKIGVPAETRTLDPLIKSQLLYQLSYGDNFGGAKIS